MESIMDSLAEVSIGLVLPTALHQLGTSSVKL